MNLKSQQSKSVHLQCFDSADNPVAAPSGIQSNWSSDRPDLLLLSTIYNDQTKEAVGSLGPTGSALVSASVLLPDQRTFTPTLPVNVTVGDIARIEIVED